MNLNHLKCITSCFVLLCSCKNEKEIISNGTESFLDIPGIDTTIAPGDNYFRYTNGKWLEKTSIPPTEVDAGSFFNLRIKSAEALLEVCQSAASNTAAPTGSLEQKVGDMYLSIMDTNAIEMKGYSPLQPIFDHITGLKNTTDLIQYICQQNINGNDVLINFWVSADEKNVSKNIAQFFQGGLGLPDRHYYFRKDESTVLIQYAYKDFLSKIFILSGDDEIRAKENADAVFNLESKIAAGHFTNVELMDPQKNYNKMGAEQLKKMSPGLDWNLIKSKLLLKTDSIIIAQPSFFSSLDRIIKATPIDNWKPYLKAHTIKNSYNSLSKPFALAGFDFFDKMLIGREQPEPRWRYAINEINGRIGQLVGQLYVKKNFDQKSKERMMSLIDGLQKSYESRIKSLDWMSVETKSKALEKLATINRKIGFPDIWRKYDSLVITKDYYQNRINTSRYEFFRAIAKVDQPVDGSEWQMNPSTVNASYDATKNEIIFPAGILQPPFFNADADDAVNYGGIGMVIGHELTHGFDDQGRLYDKDGNLKDWWSKEDADKFKVITDKIVAQYSKYVPIDSLALNGELTLNENIADIGGLAIAYDAFKMTSQGRSVDKVNGLTPDERFFMSFSTIWRIKMTDKFMRRIIHSDVHSPVEYRVVGPLSNHTPFYNAYGLTESNKMWKAQSDRIKVW